MKQLQIKQVRLKRRKRRVRKQVFGTTDRPRLTVYRSLKNIYAQIIDDDRGVTLCHASTRDKTLGGQVNQGGNRQAAAAVGKLLAERAKDQGVTQICFDRNGREYHGRLKSLADAVREGGLKF